MSTSLSVELLEQARMLAGQALSAPNQAGLRRAISAAYYSLFHRLCDSFESKFEGLRRAVDHSAVKKASEHAVAFRDHKLNGRQLGNASTSPFRKTNVSAELNIVAEHFVALQAARHTADYDVHHHHTQSDADSCILRCERAHAAWEICHANPESTPYLNLFIIDLSKYEPRKK